MTFFSIIIPVRSVNDYLRENIAHLKSLDYPSFEVIIVTDSEEDFDFGDSRFKFLASGPLGPGEKRNLGVAHASGGVIAFLDDDAYPQKDWLRKAQRIFDENPDLYALGAPALTPPGCSLLERLSGRIHESFLVGGNTVHRHNPARPRKIRDHPTVNLFVRKDAFEKIGGFCTEFWPGEDTKLCLDLVKTFERPFLYDPSPKVYHHRRELFWAHLKQVSRYARHRGQFARIFPETSRLPFYFVPTLFVLGLLLGPVISLFLPILWEYYFFILAVYLALIFLESFRIALVEKNFKAFFYSYVGIFLTHVIYGLNFLWGYIKKPSLKLRQIDQTTGNYLGG